MGGIRFGDLELSITNGRRKSFTTEDTEFWFI